MTIRDALALHHAGRFDEAEAAYRQILAAQPDHYHALHFLGVLHAQRGDMKASAELVGRAVRLNPDDALAHFHLAEALSHLDRHGEAVAHYRRALTDEFLPAHLGLARAQRGVKAPNDALQTCDNALRLESDNADVHACRGDALADLGRDDEALGAYDRAMQIAPGHLVAQLGRGRLFLMWGRPLEALAAYEAAAAENPDRAEPWTGVAAALRELGSCDEAYAALQQALAADPANAHTYYALGCMLLDMRQYQGAIAAFDSAVLARPDFAEALYNRAFAKEEAGDEAEALADCETALGVDPDTGLAATKAFMLRARHCDWSKRPEQLRELARLSSKNVALDPFTLLSAFDDPAIHAAAARFKAGPAAPAIVPPRALGSRLRVAYLSPNFHPHPVASHAVPLYETHDRAVVESYGICLVPGPETPIRARLRAAFDHFVEAGGKTDNQLAELIRTLGIDIAVEIAGHTADGRVGALRTRPAPVSVAWLGYAGTTGADYVDYIVADAVAIPPQDEVFYSEAVVRLPQSFMLRDTGLVCDPPPPRTELGLPQDAFVFSGFNNTFKITPEVFDIWMRLLKAVPGSVLWLNIQDDAARANLWREAEARGVPARRVVFAERVAAYKDHLSRLSAADLFLDTWPYGAHSTASDMLWAGVPVVTMMGRSFPARVAASMLTTAGLQQLIAGDAEGYERIALDLARDPARLGALRTKLGPANRLFDTTSYVRALEQAYQTMAEVFRLGQKRQGFSVII